MRVACFVVVAGCCIVLVTPVVAQNWVQTTAPITNWFSLVCSADGSKLVALSNTGDAPSPIFASEDTGTSWHQTSAPITNWWSLASSADGQRLFAVADVYHVAWVSTNAGGAWTARNYPFNAQSVASSADGTRLVGGGDYDIGTSADGGYSWATNGTQFGVELMQGVVSTADGTNLAAIVIVSTSYTFWLYSSTNAGETWTETPGPDNSGNWGSLVCSADGTKLVDSTALFGTFISTNWGQSWDQVPNAPNGGLIAMSADGTKWFLSDGSSIYRSTDSGVSWINIGAPHAPWAVLACSADGNLLFAGAPRGGIYKWQAMPSLRLNIALTQDNKVLLSWFGSSNSIVQQTSDLTAANWTAVTTTPVLINGQFQLLLPQTNKSSFFRASGL